MSESSSHRLSRWMPSLARVAAFGLWSAYAAALGWVFFDNWDGWSPPSPWNHTPAEALGSVFLVAWMLIPPWVLVSPVLVAARTEALHLDMLASLAEAEPREPLPSWLDGRVANWLEHSRQLAQTLEAETRSNPSAERLVWEWLVDGQALKQQLPMELEAPLRGLRRLLEKSRPQGRNWGERVRHRLREIEEQVCESRLRAYR